MRSKCRMRISKKQHHPTLMTSSSMKVLSPEVVKKYFEHFGLTCKEPEPLQIRLKVLELHVSGNGERLCWRRMVLPVITRRNTFSVCRKLVGLFPVCGWFRVAVVAIKWHATAVSSGWDDEVCDTTLRSMLIETVARVTQDDSVRGDWCVNRNKFGWMPAHLP